MKPLAICTIVREESPHIAEWLEFHRLVGVTRFFIYDDRSADDTLEVVRRHDRGDIVIHPYAHGWHAPAYYGLGNGTLPFDKTPQACAHRHCGLHHAAETFWCAFIDVDEFLFHTAIDSVPQFLEPFEDQVGVVANWLVFGSNGHATRPSGLTIENYTHRAAVGEPHPWGQHVKTIVRMDCPHRWGPHGSHTPVFTSGCQIDQDGNQNPWSMTQRPVDGGLRINHYYHRSAAEAAQKAVRNDRNAPPGYPNAERVAAHDRNDLCDTIILRFLPRLQKALQCD